MCWKQSTKQSTGQACAEIGARIKAIRNESDVRDNNTETATEVNKDRPTEPNTGGNREDRDCAGVETVEEDSDSDSDVKKIAPLTYPTQTRYT